MTKAAKGSIAGPQTVAGLSEVNLALRRLAPRDRRYVHRVAKGGLYLRVEPTGAKSWVYRHQIDGKEHWTVLGGYPAMTIREAMDAHEAKRAQAATARAGEGDGPAEIQARQKAERAAERAAEGARPTMLALTTAWIKLATGKKTGPWSERTKAENQRVADKDILPLIGTIKVADLTRMDCQRVIDATLARSAAQAAEVYKILRRLLEFAIERGYRDDHPMARVAKPYKYVPADRALSVEEVRAFLRVLTESDAAPGVKDCLRLQLLTACRPVEAREAQSGEFNVAAKKWVIPAERYKTRKTHTVALSRQALAIVEGRLGEPDALVFGAMGEAAVHQALRRMNVRFKKAGIVEAFTPHDLRRTARSLMASIGIAQEVAEACMGHAQSAIVATYNRHGYEREKAEAWQKLADRIDEVEAGVAKPRAKKRVTANVIVIRGTA